jgi:hypothetical protein
MPGSFSSPGGFFLKFEGGLKKPAGMHPGRLLAI